MSNKPLIVLDQLTKAFAGKEPIFNNISTQIDRGEFVFLTGVSGAGKSTVFRLLMGLERPDRGRVIFDNQNVAEINQREMNYHRRKIGMVFQDYKLLEKRTAKENIEIPLHILGNSGLVREKKIQAVSEKLKITHLLRQRVMSLSGGEQQLVAIARASVNFPTAIFADEPTANLDQKMANRILKMLTMLNAEGTTVIIATHDINLIKAFKKRVLLIKNAVMHEVQ